MKRVSIILGVVTVFGLGAFGVANALSGATPLQPAGSITQAPSNGASLQPAGGSNLQVTETGQTLQPAGNL